MSRIDKIALALQMLEGAEKGVQSARQLLRDAVGRGSSSALTRKIAQVTGEASSNVIEGVFDGEHMLGSDQRRYPISANYASKSQLVMGDVLKLTIGEDGSYIYKQIGPVERRQVIGTVSQDERGQFRVIAEGVAYKVLLASITFFRAKLGDELALLIPKDGAVEWAAVAGVVRQADEIAPTT